MTSVTACAWEGLGLILKKGSSPKGWFGTEIGI